MSKLKKLQKKINGYHKEMQKNAKADIKLRRKIAKTRSKMTDIMRDITAAAELKRLKKEEKDATKSDAQVKATKKDKKPAAKASAVPPVVLAS